MAYNKNYLFTHNVDWFSYVGNRWIYAASRGGLLPAKVDDEKILPTLQGICSNLPLVYTEEEISFNDALIETRYERALQFYRARLENDGDFEILRNDYSLEMFKNNFSELFGEMARRGFYAFIRLNLEDPLSSEYALVAFPKEGTPKSLIDVIHNPVNDAFVDEAYNDYIAQISFPEQNKPIDFHFKLDFMF